MMNTGCFSGLRIFPIKRLRDRRIMIVAPGRHRFLQSVLSASLRRRGFNIFQVDTAFLQGP
jgi:hypothetical protein